jgi:lysophospholipase L1-like esterase
MKLLLAFLVLLLVSGFALNRSYASIYQKIGEKHLINPNSPGVYLIDEATSTAQRMKYVAIGDSLTSGVGTASSKESFPYLLSEKIAQSGRNIELMNLGIPGARTQDVINSQLQKIISDDPDIVTVLAGVNDIHGFVSGLTFKKNYETIIDELTSKTKAKIIIINLPYLGTDDLITWPYNWLYQIRTTEFNNIIYKIAQSRGLTLVDLYKATKDQSTHNSDYYSIDQFHPSAEGYKQWSAIIYTNVNF